MVAHGFNVAKFILSFVEKPTLIGGLFYLPLQHERRNQHTANYHTTPIST